MPTRGPAKRRTALDALARAVELAEADGWVRVFVDAGPALRDLFPALAQREPESVFTRELLAAVTAAAGAATRAIRRAPTRQRSSRPGPASGGRTELVDPLSDRELDVLRLLGSDLDGPAIARELVVSLNTVRTHTKHIYTKLGVNSRRAAISKAHQLDLLSRSRNR